MEEEEEKVEVEEEEEEVRVERRETNISGELTAPGCNGTAMRQQLPWHPSVSMTWIFVGRPERRL